MKAKNAIILAMVNLLALPLAAEFAAAANCSRSPWRISLAVPSVTAHWTVVRGKACSEIVRGVRPGFSPIDNLAIVKAPKFGTAGVSNELGSPGYGYTARQYIGHDQFVVTGQFHPTFQDQPFPATFTVEVDVVDHL